jgi:hypothetical protein
MWSNARPTFETVPSHLSRIKKRRVCSITCRYCAAEGQVGVKNESSVLDILLIEIAWPISARCGWRATDFEPIIRSRHDTRRWTIGRQVLLPVAGGI